MNNEPVAWMSPDGKVSDTEGKLFYIPLYTHPVDAVNISQECVDKKQNNRHEPVAWIEEDGMVRFDVRWASQMQGKEPIPLYTHPVKELTDEELIEFIESWEGLVVTKRTMEMFRAILRKAQKK